MVVSVRLIAGNRKTGINTYESTGLKWHTKFVKDSQWEQKFIKTPGFLDSKGAPDDLYIESFFNWLWGDPQVTWNIFKTCLSRAACISPDLCPTRVVAGNGMHMQRFAQCNTLC